MPQSNSDLFVKYGLNVGAIANVAGNTFARHNLTVANTIITSDAAATHTIAGGMTVDTTSLVVDRVGQRVGIGGAPDEAKLKVFGEAKITEKLAVVSDSSVGGALAVTGKSTFADNVSCSKDVAVAGNITIDGNITVKGDIIMSANKKVDTVDVSQLELVVSGAAILRVYDSAGNLIFPNQ